MKCVHKMRFSAVEFVGMKTFTLCIDTFTMIMVCLWANGEDGFEIWVICCYCGCVVEPVCWLKCDMPGTHISSSMCDYTSLNPIIIWVCLIGRIITSRLYNRHEDAFFSSTSEPVGDRQPLKCVVQTVWVNWQVFISIACTYQHLPCCTFCFEL
jgi:hypothetical protein